METINFILSLVAVGAVFYLGKYYLPSYFQEKGKNLAQKEDIAAITSEVEKVRTEHALQIEHVRSDLSKTIFVHKVQFETEFQAFKEIWDKLLDLRNASLALRPMMDTATNSEEENKKRKQDRIKTFAESFNAFGRLAEKNKPFYPISIWKELEELIQVVRKEGFGYTYGDPADGRQYWDEALQNREQTLTKIDLICEAIRKRVDDLKTA